MAARRGGLGKKPPKPRPKECVTFVTQCVNRRSKQQGCDKGKNNPFSDLKPDANNKRRKGHTGETEQMKKIIR